MLTSGFKHIFSNTFKSYYVSVRQIDTLIFVENVIFPPFMKLCFYLRVNIALYYTSSFIAVSHTNDKIHM